jgi:hypothetical protein
MPHFPARRRRGDDDAMYLEKFDLTGRTAFVTDGGYVCW